MAGSPSVGSLTVFREFLDFLEFMETSEVASPGPNPQRRNLLWGLTGLLLVSGDPGHDKNTSYDALRVGAMMAAMTSASAMRTQEEVSVCCICRTPSREEADGSRKQLFLRNRADMTRHLTVVRIHSGFLGKRAGACGGPPGQACSALLYTAANADASARGHDHPVEHARGTNQRGTQ